MSILFILLPFLCVILLNLLPRRSAGRAAAAVAALFCLAQTAVVSSGKLLGLLSARAAGISGFDPKLDALTRLVLLCIGIVACVSVVAGEALIKDEKRRFNFACLVLLAVAGMNGVATVGDIFSLYVYLEITAVVSFVLIAFERKLDALEGAFKYIVMSALATVMMLSAISIMFFCCGSTSFDALYAALKVQTHNQLLMLAVGLLVCGFFIKSGLIPFHGWLPDAYSACPSCVSILLAGIITKVCGVYVLMRLVISVFGFTLAVGQALLFIGALSVVAGALASLAQNDFKRMLAYSSISQMGYIIMGLGCGSPLGLCGAAFHLFNHAVFKSLLFVNAAAVEEQSGTGDLDKISGLAEKMPITGLTCALASLSTAGIPPLSGFWSKLVIIMALWAGGFRAYAAIAVFASVITLAYFLSLQRRAFFGILPDELSDIKEAGLALSLVALLLACITVGAGIFFPVLLNNFIMPVAVEVLGG